MLDLQSVVAAHLADRPLTLHDFFRTLKNRQRLKPLLLETAVKKYLLEQARQEGIVATGAELQQAADAFRRHHGLSSAEQTRTWLADQYLSVLDLEEVVEEDLLLHKLKDRLTACNIAAHFAANLSGYARAQLRLILVAREDLARELVMQISEEGRDFADLARQHSLHSSGANGGRLGWFMHRQLPPAIAAALFTAAEGSVVGPLATAQGFHVYLVEKLAEPQLDAQLTNQIRDELFDIWLRKQLSCQKLEMPLLEAL